MNAQAANSTKRFHRDEVTQVWNTLPETVVEPRQPCRLVAATLEPTKTP